MVSPLSAGGANAASDARGDEDFYLLDRPDDHAAVVAAEAEAVGDGPPYPHLARRVRHVIEIAGRIGSAKVDGGMDDARLDAHHGGDQLDAAAGAEQVADHALGAANGKLAGVGAEDPLDGAGLGGVAELGAGAVGVDV